MSEPQDVPLRLHTPQLQAAYLLGQALSDSSDSDSDEGAEPGGSIDLFGSCEPVRGIPGKPTHVRLIVSGLSGIPREEAWTASTAPPGRQWLHHFLDGGPLTLTTATVALMGEAPLGDDVRQPAAPSKKSCAHPRVSLQEAGGPPGAELCTAVWPDAPGSARVRLRPDQHEVRAALLIGTEVLGWTVPLDLRPPARRFYNTYHLFKPQDPDDALVKRPMGEVRLALEFWPPGSCFSPEVQETIAQDPSLTEVETYAQVCGFCDGVGRQRCHNCNGRGAIVCAACDGMEISPPCRLCFGTGLIQENLEAITPLGSATVVGGRRCTACWGAKAPMECPECCGLKAFRCGHCRAVGWIPCSRCVGAKPTWSPC